ncbi:MAG: cbb3-type cytochrome c oxidase subunit 3 [Candidatus Thiodiazotropha sp. (ex Lucinoma kastoroae)]|nr:cbb3-type cytochrome c oxidase subunit 3 [Candidatus Thiodiazotropha sp.]MCU7801842.1 cbb3-type cytochrome c oxidase subunit 3 [Candidatus Thiodiazotropha sp. (ex Lucinoma borealis)]MCU7814430.1 cbb3-type cytochrome c oxidase subunit 3 [Candidatus Thiodiazotropha sp. (ex Rostrolucina anterorostrata)]MCU7838048.1 cbb3-type cytochrome c oxidase subunit 3 [Candidatus Thiodiazotropha sp. (ex Troendleina suluensis)]MCU7847791.1 cbb3-type cytochrome c oxidase subunit 3 [Candidatus Thiodiazotropha 
MSSLKEYFYTDWEAMTTSDWVGLVMTVVTFLLMIGVYFYALRPKNREKLEKNRFIPMDDEAIDSGEKNGG